MKNFWSTERCSQKYQCILRGNGAQPFNRSRGIILLLLLFIFFVQGERYWRYSGWPGTRQLDAGYPRLIGDGFPGVPSDLDAAFVWGKRRHIYFIKGTLRGPIFQTF